MNITEHKGDFLTFASIARGTGVPLTNDESITLALCEIRPGIYRRWVGSPYKSRSDISRDGYLGVLFSILAGPESDRNRRLDDVIKACIKTRCKVGETGDSAYTNIWPLFPMYLAARYSKWIPTLPTIAIPPMRTGFRAHLLALFILVEHMIGKRSYWHRWSMKKIIETDSYDPKYPNRVVNKDNPWFLMLYALVHGEKTNNGLMAKYGASMIQLQHNRMADSGWGSCPNEVLKGLAEFTRRLVNEA